MSGFPVSAAATQGMSFGPLALEVRGACIPDSHGTVKIRQLSADCHPQDTEHIAD